MRIGTIDLNKLRSVNDKALGLGKELVGVLVDNDRLQREGEAQQAQATEKLRALRKELDAQQHEARARVFQEKERAAQTSKSERNS
jgi:uncharacterized protein YjbJ (UPF0337 family)